MMGTPCVCCVLLPLFLLRCHGLLQGHTSSAGQPCRHMHLQPHGLTSIPAVQVIELIAEEDAPKMGYQELLQGHPSDMSQADKQQAKQDLEEAQAQLAAARSQVCMRTMTGGAVRYKS